MTEGTQFAVSGAGSTDADGGVVFFTWDFGDGTPINQSSYATHTYATAGIYTLRLTVGDNQYTQGSTQVIVTVLPILRPGTTTTIRDQISCERIGLLWTSPSTCSVLNSTNAPNDWVVSGNVNLMVRAPMTVANTGSLSTDRGATATVTNEGSLSASGNIGNSGSFVTRGAVTLLGSTFTNNTGASVTISNSTSTIGIQMNPGTLTNNGSITISNLGNSGIYMRAGVLTNSSSGTIAISNSAPSGQLGTGITMESGTATNSGTISIASRDGTGIVVGSINNPNPGKSLTNLGVITIATTGDTNAGGILNIAGGVINNGTGAVNATITIRNRTGTGLDNRGRGTMLNNAGLISVGNVQGTTGFANQDNAVVDNSGTIGVCIGSTYSGTIPIGTGMYLLNRNPC